MPSTARPLRERFDERVRRGDACWEWLGWIDKRGYGYMSVPSGRSSSRWTAAHRVAYELLMGPIPPGLTIDHLCRNRACVNPAHLEVVTRGENVRRGVPYRRGNYNSVKTHCPKGHSYDAANTALTKGGSRRCRACLKEERRAYYVKNRERLIAAQLERDRQRRDTPKPGPSAACVATTRPEVCGAYTSPIR